MEFDVSKAIEILRQTPYVLSRLLDGLSPEWTASKSNAEYWSPYDVVGHLIHGEEVDWIPRAEIILRQSGDKIFSPFDRLAQFECSGGRSLSDLLTSLPTFAARI